jgi:hypothetical protein
MLGDNCREIACHFEGDQRVSDIDAYDDYNINKNSDAYFCGSTDNTDWN